MSCVLHLEFLLSLRKLHAAQGVHEYPGNIVLTTANYTLRHRGHGA